MNTDWHDLIQRHMAGLATEEEAAHFQDSLKHDDALARLFLRYMNLDVALEAQAASTEATRALLAAPAVRRGALLRLPWRPLAAAAAACVMLAGIVFWFRQGPAINLAKVSGDVRVWRAQQTMKAANGFVLKAGDWLLTGGDGAAEVQFPGETTRLGIGANAEFGVVAAKPGKELKLTAGTLTASVARQSASHPMMIRTPTAKAEVLGTKFEMNADKVVTTMTVTEGRVLIAREDDESGVIVEAAQSATVTANAPVSVITPAPAQSLGNALIAHWKLDGDGVDASGNGNNLTLGAGVVFSTGRTGSALDLHAAKPDVESPRIALPAVFTISMWLRLEQGGPARAQPLLGFDGQQSGVDDFWLTLLPTFPGSGVVLDIRGRQMGSHAMSAQGAVRAGTWHHVAVIVDSVQGRATFFTDGRDVTLTPGLRRDFSLAGPLLIGRRVKGGTLPFAGRLDDIRIHGRALTAVEISALAGGNAEENQTR